MNGIKVGITGLDETFARYYDARTKPEDLPGDELVRGKKEIEHIGMY